MMKTVRAGIVAVTATSVTRRMRKRMDSMEKWAKVAITIVIIILMWVVVMMTVTAIHGMSEPQYCPNCGARMEN